MTEQMKPCPFCGSENIAVSKVEDRTFVMCIGCGAGTDSINCDGDPVELWNTRVHTTSQPAQAGKVNACLNCDGMGYIDSWTADGEYNPTHCETCDGGRKPQNHQPAAQATPGPVRGGDLLHHPFTPSKAEFDALYLDLCARPITGREIARRCWKAAMSSATPTQQAAGGLRGRNGLPEAASERLP